VVATVPVPGSKSETNRAYVLAALSAGPSTITGALESRDATLMRDGLTALGVRLEKAYPAGICVEHVIPPAHFTPAPDGIDVGLAGTVMRFLPAVAALAPGATSFYGDPRASERPIAPLLRALSALGVRVDGERIPFTMCSPTRLSGRTMSVAAQESSQFVSALLLAGARYPEGIELLLTSGRVPSRPHIDMTIAMLRARGVLVTEGHGSFTIAPSPIAAIAATVTPDLSNAAAFLAAGVLTGGQVKVPDWPFETTQPGDLIRAIIVGFGGRVERTATGVVVAGADGDLSACDLDLGAASELTPVVAALAAFSRGTSHLGGIGHIRGHETDRIAAIAATLRAVGVRVEETADGLNITGATSRLTPALLPTYADHRIAHLAALIGLRVPGVLLDDVATTAKTMPDFPATWRAMVTGEPPR
jgi:3-phosphoshikimate 1-carboxyvinyltransferase